MRIGGKAPGGGPILSVGIGATSAIGFPPPRIIHRQFALNASARRIGKKMFSSVTFQPAGRKMTPSNVSPVVTKRQSAISSLRARATIMVLRVPLRLSPVRARYHCASALCF